MELLVLVSLSADINKMNASNLGIVFGPTLMWKKESDPMNDMMINIQTSDVVSYIIENFNEIFTVLFHYRKVYFSETKD
jgi:hypothetical protein